ncbi:MAG: hypothetical protein WCS18_12570 [Sphaerochaetaceae bacterium]
MTEKKVTNAEMRWAVLVAQCYIRARLRGNVCPKAEDTRLSDDEITKALSTMSEGRAAKSIRAVGPGIVPDACLQSAASGGEIGRKVAKATPYELRRILREGPSIEDALITMTETPRHATVVPYSALEAIGKEGLEQAFLKRGVKVSVSTDDTGCPFAIQVDWLSGDKSTSAPQIPAMPTVLIRRKEGGD